MSPRSTWYWRSTSSRALTASVAMLARAVAASGVLLRAISFSSATRISNSSSRLLETMVM